MCSKSLWSLEWTTAVLTQPWLDYIRKGLNGIKDSADVSPTKICPFCFVGPLVLVLLVLFLFFFFTNELPGPKVEEPEDPIATTFTQSSAQLSFQVPIFEEMWSDWSVVFCSPPRVLIMLREPFYEVTSTLKMLRPCVSLHPLSVLHHW